MPRVIHTAQALVDAVLEVPALPARGGNVMATSYRRYAGGAVTILLAAARSGARCVHAGAVGTGPNADLVRAALAAEGIEVSSPPVPDLDTGVCVVLVEPTAERSFVTTQGLSGTSPSSRCAASRPAPGTSCASAATRSWGAPATRCSRGSAPFPTRSSSSSTRGRPSPSSTPALRDRVLARTTSGPATPRRPPPPPVWPGWTRAPASSRPSCARMPWRSSATGRGGARCARPGDGPLPGHPQRPVDTNGAGDTHTGVLLAERAAGSSWRDAAARANAAGAIKVTRRGPDTAPTRVEIDEFLGT